MCRDLTSLSDTRNLNYKPRISALLLLRQIYFRDVAYFKLLCKCRKGNFWCELWLWAVRFDIFLRQWALLVTASVSPPCFLQPDPSAPRTSFLPRKRKEISLRRLSGHTLSSMKTDGRGKNVLSLSSLWHSNWNPAGMRTAVPCMASPSLPWTWAMLRPGTWHRQTCWALPGAWELTGRASASTWAWPTSRLSA